MSIDLNSAREIFVEAVGKTPPEQWEAFLSAKCGADTELRQHVERLLRAHVESGSFLDQPAVGRLADNLGTPEPTQEARAQRHDANNGREALDFLAPSDQPGTLGRLGHYRILDLVGRGGMGIVLKALDEKLHRVVAIKVMASELAASGTARQRFIREAQAAAAVAHEHVVTIHAVEEEHRPPYLVMQFIDGVSLQQKLDEHGALAVQKILRIGAQTAAGLAAAHAQGLIHRDVKPANILLENGVERVKITDFGLARAVNDASITQSGMVAGTPQYMSPEQAGAERLDHRSDLFSLGSVLYAMCTGRPPFRGSTAMAVLKRVCEATSPPIRDSNPDVPGELVALIEKLHAKDPAGRFQSAQKVAEQLRELLARLQQPSAEPSPTAPRSPVGTSPRRRWAVLVGALFTLMAGFALTEVTGLTHLVSPAFRGTTPDDGTSTKVDDEKNRDEGGPSPAGEKGTPANPLKSFVILAGAESAAQELATLAEAVAAARSQDTIELRGNGPFMTPQIDVVGKSLVIRAGRGFRPIIRLDPAASKVSGGLFVHSGQLILEGLELQNLADGRTSNSGTIMLSYGPLYMANCRLLLKHQGNAVEGSGRVRELRNCDFLGGGWYKHLTHWYEAPDQGRITVNNCLLLGGLKLDDRRENREGASIQLRHTTVVDHHALAVVFHRQLPSQDKTTPPQLRLEVSESIFDSPRGAVTAWRPEASLKGKPQSQAEVVSMLPVFLEWRGSRNLYPASGLLGVAFPPGDKEAVPTEPRIDLAEWRKLWNSPETGSVDGRPRFQGGNLALRAQTEWDKLTPADFRLLVVSPGYRAGEDGRDLGADVDLVGPGAAYERWKQTPEYQQWLKDTGQVK